MKQAIGMILCVCALSAQAETDLTTLHSGGTISGSASYSTFVPAKAFDDVAPTNSNGRWLALLTAEKPAWVQYRFPGGQSYNVGRYTIWNSTFSGWTTRAPRDFNLKGSSNGTDWVTLDARAGEAGWGNAEGRTYFVADASKAYEYYRLTVTTNNGDATYMAISELELFEPPAGPPAAPASPGPTNGAYNVSINGFLTWDGDSQAKTNIVYLGTNAVLTEADLFGGTAGEALEFAGLLSNATYSWRVVSLNDNGSATGGVWQFTTMALLPELVAYDGFEGYAAGPLNGSGSEGSGWAGAWSAVSSSVAVVSETLRYVNGGVSVNGGARAVYYPAMYVSPLLQRDTLPIAYGPAYFSLLVKGQGMQNDVNSFVLRDLGYSGGPDGVPHSLGVNFARADSDTPPGYIDAEVYGASDRRRGFTSVAPTNNVTYFVVVRLTRSANTEYETAEVLVNPSSATEPATGWTSVTFTECAAKTLSAFAIRAAVMDLGDWIMFDELRIGTTYEAVVPRKMSGTLIRVD